MTLDDITNLRLINQQLTETNFKTPKEIVNWMGAMQAQDYAMSKWAIGIRLQNSTEKLINEAIDKGEIIRTHLLRPTWHFVSSDDIYWMLDLAAPKIISSLKSRHKQLGLTDAVIKKCNKIIEKALIKEKYLTRDELKKVIEKAKIDTGGNRLSHIFIRAELEGLICGGPEKRNKITYALLEERVPKKSKLKRDEALAILTKKYFSSHCPATIKDFAWWAGLTLNDAKRGFESVKSKFILETVKSETYILSNSFRLPDKKTKSIHLLPAFDEFTISYRNRSASLSAENNKITVSSNGMFFPIILINGKAAGLWKRTKNKGKITVEINLYKKSTKAEKELIKNAANRYGEFLNRGIDIFYNSGSKTRNSKISDKTT